ncbi:hypothetical protein [Haladaptatus cibarius]|uniref:hypothetical protein n=1 Tax=Haladaptatus cibarius TaxID=453847 RepID=UPI000678EB73|nr:hypothetical protein [Haladaptatus cibarius]
MSSFERLDLRISPEEATDLVRHRLDDLRVVRRDGAIEFRTATGFVVATLHHSDEENETKARLRYRTAPRLPVYLHKVSKGEEIRDALFEFRVT